MISRLLASVVCAASCAAAMNGCSSAAGGGGNGGHTGGTSSGGAGGRDADAAPEAGALTPGWHLTTYFSAVESFFAGAPVAVTGCLDVDCSSGGDPDNVLGDFPDDFVDTVQAEGTGRIDSGPSAGRFLNWSAGQPGSGFWLDDAPRDAQGTPLVAYVSAAAHPSYAYGATFSIVDCGVDQTTAQPMNAAACGDFQKATWEVRDRFENDAEVRHVDLYIGLQTEADMNDDPHFVDQVDAVMTLP